LKNKWGPAIGIPFASEYAPGQCAVLAKSEPRWKPQGVVVEKEKTNQIREFGYRKPRFRTDFHFLLQTEGQGSQLLSARCTDLSEEGLAAFVSAQLDVGTAVTFILTLPETATAIRLKAVVSYRVAECHGFKFVFSSDREREFVHRYLAALRSGTDPLKQSK